MPRQTKRAARRRIGREEGNAVEYDTADLEAVMISVHGLLVRPSFMHRRQAPGIGLELLQPRVER